MKRHRRSLIEPQHLRASVGRPQRNHHLADTRVIERVLITKDNVSLVLSCTHVVILKRMPRGEYGFCHGYAGLDSFDTGEAYYCEECGR
jgi:hypothetical protein